MKNLTIKSSSNTIYVFDGITNDINHSPYAELTPNPTDCRRAVNSSIAT